MEEPKRSRIPVFISIVILLLGAGAFAFAYIVSMRKSAGLNPLPFPETKVTDLTGAAPLPTANLGGGDYGPTSTPIATITPTPTLTVIPTATPKPTVKPTIKPTATPLKTASPTSTPTTAPFQVTDISGNANPTTISSCPGSITVTGSITVNKAGTLTYVWKSSDGRTGPSNSITFDTAGSKNISDTWNFTNGFKGNIYVENLNNTPNVARSNNVQISICQ